MEDKKFLTAMDCHFDLDRKCISPERLKEIECIFEGRPKQIKSEIKVKSKNFIEASLVDDD